MYFVCHSNEHTQHRPRGHVASAYGLVGFRRFIALDLAASVDWGCAVQITAAASIGSGQTYVATNSQTLYVTFRIDLTSTCLHTNIH